MGLNFHNTDREQPRFVANPGAWLLANSHQAGSADSLVQIQEPADGEQLARLRRGVRATATGADEPDRGTK